MLFWSASWSRRECRFKREVAATVANYPPKKKILGNSSSNAALRREAVSATLSGGISHSGRLISGLTLRTQTPADLAKVQI